MKLLGACGLAALIALSACGDDSPSDAGTSDTGGQDSGRVDTGTPDSGGDAGPGDSGADAGLADAGDIDAGSDAGVVTKNPDCDSLMPEVCAFPWPSNLYLRPDGTTSTGYRLGFGTTSLPSNNANPPSHVSPDPYQFLDGYGVGSPIMVLFPNVDASELPDENHIGSSLTSTAAILLFRHDTSAGDSLVRVPYFVDWDLNESDPAERILFIRPAVVLEEASEYVVAIRGLKDLSGNALTPSEDFAKLVAGDTVGDPLLADRQPIFDATFGLLEGAGLTKAELLLAWGFTTGSSEGIHGRLLHMRDEALATVGAMGPELTITYTGTVAPDGRKDEGIAYDIEGTFRVPNYLTNWTLNNSITHTALNYGNDDLPEQNGFRNARFWARIPESAFSSTVTLGLLMHGHGQLGSGTQIWDVRSGRYNLFANQYDYILFSCDMIGMSEAEEVPLGVALGDFSGFKWIGDTLHQGMLEHVLLARAMKQRFTELPEIQNLGIQATIDTDDFAYFGISQGGIFGASVVALSPDIDRGHLGVGGQNYSTILWRSRNFVEFFDRLVGSYPRSADQALIVALAQLQFDATESISYVRHLSTNSLDGQTNHVLMAHSKGDYQVSPMTNWITARSGLDIPLMANYDDERTPFDAPVASYPRVGSGMVLYDFGNPWPPAGNHYFDDQLSSDPHSYPRRLRAHNDQLVHFLRTGEIIDVCGGSFCDFPPQ